MIPTDGPVMSFKLSHIFPRHLVTHYIPSYLRVDATWVEKRQFQASCPSRDSISCIFDEIHSTRRVLAGSYLERELKTPTPLCKCPDRANIKSKGGLCVESLCSACSDSISLLQLWIFFLVNPQPPWLTKAWPHATYHFVTGESHRQLYRPCAYFSDMDNQTQEEMLFKSRVINFRSSSVA